MISVIPFNIRKILVDHPATVSFGFCYRFIAAALAARDLVLRIETLENELTRRDEFRLVLSAELERDERRLDHLRNALQQPDAFLSRRRVRQQEFVSFIKPLDRRRKVDPEKEAFEYHAACPLDEVLCKPRPADLFALVLELHLPGHRRQRGVNVRDAR